MRGICNQTEINQKKAILISLLGVVCYEERLYRNLMKHIWQNFVLLILHVYANSNVYFSKGQWHQIKILGYQWSILGHTTLGLPWTHSEKMNCHV